MRERKIAVLTRLALSLMILFSIVRLPSKDRAAASEQDDGDKQGVSSLADSVLPEFAASDDITLAMAAK